MAPVRPAAAVGDPAAVGRGLVRTAFGSLFRLEDRLAGVGRAPKSGSGCPVEAGLSGNRGWEDVGPVGRGEDGGEGRREQ